jgi:hypothetical protein
MKYQLIERQLFKKLAKTIQKLENIKPTIAHERLAKMLGFNCHNHYLVNIHEIDGKG